MIGEEVVRFPVVGGRAAGPVRVEVDPRGSFIRRWGNEPRFTRVGAVLALEEQWLRAPKEDGTRDWKVVPNAWVLHNPAALNRIPTMLWGESAQFTDLGEDLWGWTDGIPWF
ncbi:MAG: hypothetical protein ACRD1T_12360 [Acidimicrobiia bacterium]